MSQSLQLSSILVRGRYLARALEVSNRAKLYLDVRYWIELRDAATGSPKTRATKELLQKLRELVLAGRLICPLSETIFSELMKQSDQASRHATAAVIDELSLGVTLRPLNDRVAEEIRYALAMVFSGGTVAPAEHFIWSCPTSVLGHDGPPLFRNLSFRAHGQWTDRVWATSLAELLDKFGDLIPAGSPFDEAFASRINRESMSEAHKLRSFEHTYESELRGACDLAAPMFKKIINELAVQKGYSKPTEPAKHQENFAKNTLYRLITHADYQTLLPTLRIIAALHAAVRWDKHRKFKRNDFYDFYHAAAAFGYCNGFLAEKSLSSLVQAKNLKLPRSAACPVASSVEESLDLVRSFQKSDE